jgi:hypothetical protein
VYDSYLSSMRAQNAKGVRLLFGFIYASQLIGTSAFVPINFQTLHRPPRNIAVSLKCTSTIQRSTDIIPSMDAGNGEKLLGSRRLHRALNKPDSSHRVRKDPPPTSFTPCGDWGKVLPISDCPKRPPLDKLSEAELQRVLDGERLQKQSRSGRTGHGLVVCDVKAEASVVYAVLSDIQRYPLRVPTVREAAVQFDSPHAKICKAQFKLSRFHLEINAELRCLRERNAIEFRLDPERRNPVLEQARGFWFVEDATFYGRGKGWTRVWLVADVTCSPLLPSFLIDYAASRALPRATTWLSPVIEAISASMSASMTGDSGTGGANVELTVR